MSNIYNHEMLEEVTQEFTSIAEKLWYEHSKVQWNKEYNKDLVAYQTSRKKTDWIKYRKVVKMAK